MNYSEAVAGKRSPAFQGKMFTQLTPKVKHLM